MLQKVFLQAIKNILEKGRENFRNILIKGPGNTGKHFLLVHWTLCTGHSVTQVHPRLGGWVGRSRKGRGYCLQWLQMEPQIIQWHNLLQMLEGQSSHLPAPKSYFSKDLEFTRHPPSFLHRETGFALRQGEVIDKRETKWWLYTGTLFNFNDKFIITYSILHMVLCWIYAKFLSGSILSMEWTRVRCHFRAFYFSFTSKLKVYYIAKYNLKKIVKIKTERICRWGSVKCRLSTDWGLLFSGLENNGTIVVKYSFAWCKQ